MHIYYLYSTVSTDTDHIRFLQIVIDDSNWGLAGTYGCFNRQPSQGGVHRHHGSGRLAEVYSMPYKNNGIWLLSQVHLARSCWMANRIEMEGTQDPWLSGQIGLLSLGKPIYVLFSGIGVRYGCPQHCIYIYIYTRNVVLTFGFFLTFGSFVLSWLRLRPHFTFLAPWQEQAQWDHVFDGEMKVQ